MKKIVELGALLVLFGCATSRAAQTAALQERGDPEHPLYVGHSDTGDVVVAASHFDAMSGVAVAATDVGQKGQDKKGEEKLICAREMLTGTHVATWICRYPKDAEAERRETQDFLDRTRNCQGPGACGGK